MGHPLHEVEAARQNPAEIEADLARDDEVEQEIERARAEFFKRQSER